LGFVSCFGQYNIAVFTVKQRSVFLNVIHTVLGLFFS
jgi:hypothetical protein